MPLPTPVVSELITSVSSVVNFGFGILDNLVQSHLDFKAKKLALEELQARAEEARRTLELEVNLDIRTREANVKILQNMMKVAQDVVRTDVELKLLAQASNANLSLMIISWQQNTAQEFVRFKDEVLTNLSQHLIRSQSLPELQRDRFISLAYENYERSTEMLLETDATARRQAEALAAAIRPIDTQLQATLTRLAGMSTLQLLDEYPQE